MKILALDDRGIALVTLVVAIAIFGTLAMAVQTFVGQNAVSGVVVLDRARALYLAEAGLNDSFWEVKYSGKLYGPDGQDYGDIDARTVVFEGGVAGSYTAGESGDMITGSGSVNGLTRDVRTGVTIPETAGSFSLFQWGGRDLTINSRTGVSGNVYVNGSVGIVKPTSMDEDDVTFNVPFGESVHYTDGDPIDYTEQDPAPQNPALSTSFYDVLISRAASEIWWIHIWGDRALADTVMARGILWIYHHSDITSSGGSSMVVVDGSVVVDHHCTVADGITFIASNGVTVNGNETRIGSTAGRSGNLIFARNSSIAIGSQVLVNGTLLTDYRISISGPATVNGLAFAADMLSLADRVTVNGSVWTRVFGGDRIGSRSVLTGNDAYLPSAMPPGVAPPGCASGTGEARLAGNWREIRL